MGNIAETKSAAEVLPERFLDVDALDEFITRPSQALVTDLEAVDGDIMIIGASGKMGPHVARLAKRADPSRRIIGVARFGNPAEREVLERAGIETIASDILDPLSVADLPMVPNIIFMAGRKFGSQADESLTWAVNSYAPALVAQRFLDSRIVVYSTACVYPFVPVAGGGASEDGLLDPPGEYAMSCVGRERIFQHFSGKADTPLAVLRLSYAIDMRYGVLHDIAQKVINEETIDVSMGHVNIIWQGDACTQSLRALRHCSVPGRILNISGPEIVSVRQIATVFGSIFGKTPLIVGKENETAWLVNTSRAEELFGYPTVPVGRLISWTADWVGSDRGSLGKATHFEVRSGVY